MNFFPLLLLLACALPSLPAFASPPSPPATLSFEGNSTFPKERILRALRHYEVKTGGKLTRMDADDAAFFVREFYEEQGFWEAEVDYSYNALAGSALLSISEGPGVALGQIRFEGSSPFPAERMTDIVTASLRRSARSLFGKLRFVEFANEEAAAALAQSLLQKGYLAARVTSSSEPAKIPNSRDVTFWIESGPCFIVRSIRTEGCPDTLEIPKNFFADSLHHPYTPDEDLLLRGQLLRLLRDRGFFAAEAEIIASTNEKNGDVHLLIRARPGNLYRLGSIRITGQHQTKTSAILGTLGLRQGEPYNASQLREANRRLWFTGAFSKIDVTPQPTPDGSLQLDISVEEAKAKQLRATLGFSEWLLLFGSLDYTDRNFLGTLNHLNIKAEASTKGYSTQAALKDPFLFQSELAGSIGTFYSDQSWPGYKATIAGGVLGIERVFQTPNETGFRLQYVLRGVFDTTIYGETATLSRETNYTVGMLGWGQTLDRRNDPISPMQGFLLKYDLALASQTLGGDLNFFKPEAQASFYLPLKKITPERAFVPFFFANHKIGSIFPFSGTGPVPAPERFFLGGPDSVRSFQLDGMAPRDDGGNPLGGEFFWQTNLEMQLPVWGPFYTVGFVDFGNLSLTPQDYAWDETRIAPGMGMRFYTPIGAVRVDYGYNLVRKDGDPAGALQFGFGFNF